MRLIADAIERGLHAANYHADLASKRRSLSAWGTVERRGAGWSWTWTGVGIPAKGFIWELHSGGLPGLLRKYAPPSPTYLSRKQAWIGLAER